MCVVKYIAFIFVFEMVFPSGLLLALHSSGVPDLRDFIRKEELKNEFTEQENFKHRPMMLSRNQIQQKGNSMLYQEDQNHEGSYFKTENPFQAILSPSPVHMPTFKKKPVLSTLQPIAIPEELELQKAEKLNEAFQKLLQFLSIMGQVDEYVTSKAQSTIKAIAKITEDNIKDARVKSNANIF